jgi:hypothetical protein
MKIWSATGAAFLAVSAIGTAAAAGTKPVQLSKVVLDPEGPKADQKIKVGTICLFAGTPLDFGSNARTMSNDVYERLFVAAMQKRGYTVVGKSTEMFEGEGTGPKAEFLIGAKFHPTVINLCDSVNGQKGLIGISVDWQIFDRSKQSVVATVTTEGQGVRAKFDRSGLSEMVNEAFSDAVLALADKGVLEPLLGKPTPPTS